MPRTKLPEPEPRKDAARITSRGDRVVNYNGLIEVDLTPGGNDMTYAEAEELRNALDYVLSPNPFGLSIG